MRNAMRYRGSIFLPSSHHRTSGFRDTRLPCTASLMTSTLRLGNCDERIYRRAGYHLSCSGWPLDDDAIHPFVRAKSKVQSPVVLARESGPSVNHASLPEISSLDDHFGADRAAIAPCSYQPKGDPVIRAVGKAAINHCGLIL